MENNRNNKKPPALSAAGICLEAAAALIYLLTYRLDGLPALFFALFILILPVIGMICGIIAIISYRLKHGVLGFVLAIAAVAIPIVTVGTLIILMASRVIIITFM